jgi:cellulose synthase/poly-beta-1,6-N-acetylglucosamine synthase-like glycosyltransferase
MNLSIILCTCDRLDSLQHTIGALARLAVPTNFAAQLLVINNGSRDATPEYLAGLNRKLGSIEVVALTEPRRGKSRALNRALEVARGEVILFTDDDVIPPIDWIEKMCSPIWTGEADAVAGGLKLGAEIRAKGLSEEQLSWFAMTGDGKTSFDTPLIGANMAVSRHVFQKVPWFDPEVGPGAIGHAEDILFWLQVRAANFKIVTRYDVVAQHNPDVSRTTWHAMAHLAKKRGEFSAYIDYHWNRNERRYPFLALQIARLALWKARLSGFASWINAKTLPDWEMKPLEDFCFRRHLLIERKRSPNFDRNGLIKRGGVLPDGTPATGSITCSNPRMSGYAPATL